MDPRENRLWFWVGFVVLAVLAFSVGSGWFKVAAAPGIRVESE
jgi:hypothetical protein